MNLLAIGETFPCRIFPIYGSCLCISVLKYGTMKPDGVFVLGGYSKWKDRSVDKQEIEYHNLLTSAAQLGITGLCH